MLLGDKAWCIENLKPIGQKMPKPGGGEVPAQLTAKTRVKLVPGVGLFKDML